MSEPESLVERLTVDAERLKLSKRADLHVICGDVREAAAELSALRSRCDAAEHALAHEIRIKCEAIADYRREKAARDEAVAALEEAREALRVIATGSGYEWSETREQLHRIIDAAVECASNALTQPSGKEKG